MQPTGRNYTVEAGASYRVEVIDTWRMTVEDAGIAKAELIPKGEFGAAEGAGRLHVRLPGRQYMAVRLTKVQE